MVQPLHTFRTHELTIDLGAVQLSGTLTVPRFADALVLVPHLARPGRRSHRSRRLVADLHAHRIATFAVDLVTAGESLRPDDPDDLDVLAERLVDATDWIRARRPVWDLPIGYLAADASPVALIAAAARPAVVRAVVSWGGHPELAVHALPRLEAAALLLAPGEDPEVLEQNRHAIAALLAIGWVETVPDAAALGGDDAQLDDIARRAIAWFSHHAVPVPHRKAS